MSKVVVVLGASGTVGVGFTKVCLDSKQGKVVGVFRSAASVEKTLGKLGNPSDSEFIPVIGSLETEDTGADLKKLIESKAGSITDVVSCVGNWIPNGPMLSQPAEKLVEGIFDQALLPHFIAAKTFIPALCDKPGTTFTFINGASSMYKLVITNTGNLVVGSAAQSKMSMVLMAEYKEKCIRVNEIGIGCRVIPWDSAEFPPNNVSNLDMGKAILGTLVHPAARSVSMSLAATDLDKLANTGIVDTVNDYVVLDM